MTKVLAVDIGGTQVKAARVDGEGRIEDSRRCATPESLVEFRRMARAFAAELGSATSAAGVGCKGIIDTVTSRVEVLPGTVHYLEGEVLSEVFGCPVAADNDARVALVGERRWGAARGRENVVMLTLGTGVGGGVLSGGKLVRGAGGAGGHLGHYTVDPGGAPCICGNRGCLETVFSSRAIEAAAFDAMHRGVASVLLEGPKPPACEQVFQAAIAGDGVAAGIVNRAREVLAGAIAGMIFTFDPEVVILGGQIVEAGEYLLAPLREEVWRRTRGLLRRDVPVMRTQLADPAGVLGAAALALENSTLS
ncbi:MAG: ROK family protein [Bryobacterales bacterium]|nr:ROK family protein [Bryobacterales bacterium]